MHYRKWMTVLAAFLLLGFVLNLGEFGWAAYSLAAIALLGRYHDMQARIAAGDVSAALFTREEVQEARDNDVTYYADATDWTIYPAGSRELQWMAYDEGKDIHPDDCRPLY